MMESTSTSKPHVTPLKVYLGVAAALLTLTGITVGVSFVNFGPWNLVVALVIAGIKMSLVALVFMHLYYDYKLYFAIFAIAIGFLLLFIILTMFDTLRRGDIDPEKAVPIHEITEPLQSVGDSAAYTDSLAEQHESR